MQREGRYETSIGFPGFDVHLFGAEGQQNVFDITLRLKQPRHLSSYLEKYCSQYDIPCRPNSSTSLLGKGRKRRNVVSYQGCTTIYYNLDESEISVKEFSGQTQETELQIKGSGDSLEDSIERAKSSYETLSPFIQSLGYDTSHFDSYLSSFTAETLRGNRITDLFSIFQGGGVNTISQLPKGLIGILNTEGEGPTPIIIASSDSSAPPSPPFPFPPFSNQGYIKKRTPDGKPSLYASIVREETKTGTKKYAAGIPKDIAVRLLKEVDEYEKRGLMYVDKRNYANALLDANRVIRILDYLLDNIAKTDLRTELRQDTLNMRAAMEYNRAISGSTIALSEKDFDRALRFMSRAKDFLEHFYQDVHILELPTFEPPENPRQAVDKQLALQKLIPPYAKAKQIRDGLFEDIAKQIQEINIQRHSSENHSTKFSPGKELTLEQLLDYYAQNEQFEQATEVRDLIKRRNLEDPLELKKAYTI